MAYEQNAPSCDPLKACQCHDLPFLEKEVSIKVGLNSGIPYAPPVRTYNFRVRIRIRITIRIRIRIRVRVRVRVRIRVRD